MHVNHCWLRFDEAEFCKPSGSLSSPLVILWNYAATIKTCGWPIYGVISEMRNPCLSIAAIKLGLTRTFAGIVDNNLMFERNTVRYNKPKMFSDALLAKELLQVTDSRLITPPSTAPPTSPVPRPIQRPEDPDDTCDNCRTGG